LDFQFLEILTADWVWRAQMHHRARFCQNGSNGCGYGDLSRWGNSLSWIVKFMKFKLPVGCRRPRCINMLDLV